MLSLRLETDAPIRVMLTDDHAVVREGYRRLLELEPDVAVVGECPDAETARAQLEEMLAKHSTTPIEKIREDIERDKILTAEDALSYGLIDQIISTRKMNNDNLR